MEARSKRDEIIEIVNKLFIYTDEQQWDQLLHEVFKENVYFNMSSLGSGDPQLLEATKICDLWKSGFEGIDAIHHQSGNFLVKFIEEEGRATVFCYAIAMHYKNGAQSKTTEYVGSYDLNLVLTDLGWRIDGFKYNLKFIRN
jgi:hypothetical protein